MTPPPDNDKAHWLNILQPRIQRLLACKDIDSTAVYREATNIRRVLERHRIIKYIPIDEQRVMYELYCKFKRIEQHLPKMDHRQKLLQKALLDIGAYPEEADTVTRAMARSLHARLEHAGLLSSLPAAIREKLRRAMAPSEDVLDLVECDRPLQLTEADVAAYAYSYKTFG